MNRRSTKTVAETVAGNVRAFRQLRGLEQGGLARRMVAVGVAWRQATVSEIEREQRNVTVAELLALALTLGTTIEQLLDPRGPERIRGPWLSIGEGPLAVDPDRPEPEFPTEFPPDRVTGLVCTHADYPVVEWDEEAGIIKSLYFAKAEPR